MRVIKLLQRDRRLILSLCFFCILHLFFIYNPVVSNGQEAPEQTPESTLPPAQEPAEGRPGPSSDESAGPEAVTAPAVAPPQEPPGGALPGVEDLPPIQGEAAGEDLISPEAEVPAAEPPQSQEASPLQPQEGTVAMPAEAPAPARGILTRINEDILKKIELRGYFKSEIAYRYVTPAAFSKILNIVQLEPSYSFNSDVRLSARIWAYYDLAYDLQDVGTIAPVKAFTFIEPPAPGEPDPDIKNLREIETDNYGIDLRELYVDIFLSKMDFRIGRQIIRWGIVEGWRILDEVNPLDFTEHILRDVSDRYIPLWMVKGDYYAGPLTIEGLWVPDIKGHKPAPLRSEWSHFQTLPDLKKVPRNFKNSEGGLRVSGMVRGYEFAAAYFNQ